MRNWIFALVATGLTASVADARAASPDVDDPLLRPIAPSSAARWLAPQEPKRIHGDTFLVGFGGLNVGLIRTDAGLILIDGAVPQGVPAIEANIRRLGFQLKDVKFILSTEPHFDHAGGLAALARDTGATVVASTPAAAVLRQGRSGSDDPQYGGLAAFPPVQKLRIIGDGETLRLGRTVVTARATPGHTAGSMSWTWRSCEGGKCLDVVFASSLNPVSADGYRFSAPEHAAVVTSLRQTFQVVRALPCDLLLTAHPDQSGGDAKFKRYLSAPSPNPFVVPGACQAYAGKYEGVLAKRLASEAGG
ncbi:subclass B3 metallo-beta-lactamase [Caulobacter sp. Root655]|nr:subclass B3 metallo-beta-lactamase [Caulobacter sp. Root655]